VRCGRRLRGGNDQPEILVGIDELGRDEAVILAEGESCNRRMHHRDISQTAANHLEFLLLRAGRVERRLPLVLEIERVDGEESKRLRRLLENGENPIVRLLPHP
jgi:hypothetical protein